MRRAAPQQAEWVALPYRVQVRLLFPHRRVGRRVSRRARTAAAHRCEVCRTEQSMDADETQGSEAPVKPEPRRSSRRRLVVVALALVVAGIVIGGAGMHLMMRGHEPAATAAKKAPLYQCPMHPAITSDHPGDCPICGMKLVLVSSASTNDSAPAKPGARTIARYRSPMDPKQTSPVPRKDEMGMDYVPVYEDELAAGAPVQGLATVNIDPARQQLIGLRTVAVTKGSIGATWRTPARIQIDPTQVRKTNVKVEGFVEKIYVDFVGQSVRRGQPLFSIYSPSLLAAQNEYLLALQTSEVLAKGAALSEDGQNLMVSARRRLELWDVPAAEIDRGARVSPGEAPYEITDLREIWGMADAYETDLSRIHVGMKASLTLPAYPDR